MLGFVGFKRSGFISNADCHNYISISCVSYPAGLSDEGIKEHRDTASRLDEPSQISYTIFKTYVASNLCEKPIKRIRMGEGMRPSKHPNRRWEALGFFLAVIRYEYKLILVLRLALWLLCSSV